MSQDTHMIAIAPIGNEMMKFIMHVIAVMCNSITLFI